MTKKYFSEELQFLVFFAKSGGLLGIFSKFLLFFEIFIPYIFFELLFVLKK